MLAVSTFQKTKELCNTLKTPCDNLKLMKRGVIYTGAYDCVGGGGGYIRRP